MELPVTVRLETPNEDRLVTGLPTTDRNQRLMGICVSTKLSDSSVLFKTRAFLSIELQSSSISHEPLPVLPWSLSYLSTVAAGYSLFKIQHRTWLRVLFEASTGIN